MRRGVAPRPREVRWIIQRSIVWVFWCVTHRHMPHCILCIANPSQFSLIGPFLIWRVIQLWVSHEGSGCCFRSAFPFPDRSMLLVLILFFYAQESIIAMRRAQSGNVKRETLGWTFWWSVDFNINTADVMNKWRSPPPVLILESQNAETTEWLLRGVFGLLEMPEKGQNQPRKSHSASNVMCSAVP